MVAIDKITVILTTNLTDWEGGRLIRYHWVSTGMVALVPVMHALCDLTSETPVQAINLLQLVGLNSLGALGYLARLPERSSLVGDWRPSLYIMHLALILNSIWYSRVALELSV